MNASRRAVLIGSCLAATGCAGGSLTQSSTQQVNLVVAIASDSDFNRFQDAMRRTGVDRTLAEPGPFTVFAPTDSGWGDIPVNIREAVLPANGPADPIRGRALVIAHVVAGRYMAADFAGKTTTLTTLNGNRIEIDGRDARAITVVSDGGGGFSAGGGRVLYGSSRITRADISATNGVIHVVNKAVLP